MPARTHKADYQRAVTATRAAAPLIDSAERRAVCAAFVAFFAPSANFDRARFIDACGVEPDDIERARRLAVAPYAVTGPQQSRCHADGRALDAGELAAHRCAAGTYCRDAEARRLGHAPASTVRRRRARAA